MEFEKRKQFTSDDLSLSNLQLHSVNKQTDNNDLLQKCLSIRKILFDENNIQSGASSSELGRFTFQEKINKARHQMDKIESPIECKKLNKIKKNETLLYQPQLCNQNMQISIIDLKRMQAQIADYPNKKFDELSDEYLNDLVELAQIISYRIKLQ